jgi:hypothetical protein
MALSESFAELQSVLVFAVEAIHFVQVVRLEKAARRHVRQIFPRGCARQVAA